jgi:hypothetical protein
MSKKFKGADSILYNAKLGTLVTSGTLVDGDTPITGWYKIKAFATAASALPTGLKVGSIFKTPEDPVNAITLVAGDEVWPLTLTEVCKVDVEVSGEMGAIDATDSCDYPYMVNLPDGFVNLSGSINTMLRFDDETEELVAVTKDWLVKFFDIVEDDGEGIYTVSNMNTDDLLLMILMNSRNAAAGQIVTNWLITPATLTGNSMQIAMKDVLKADYSWSKGQGPACIYTRMDPSAS